jgi:hypothetical protein
MRPQSGFDPSSVLLLTPWNGDLRIGRLVRSGSLMAAHLQFNAIGSGLGQGAVVGDRILDKLLGVGMGVQ